MAKDYLQLALAYFNTDKGQWYKWKKEIYEKKTSGKS